MVVYGRRSHQLLKPWQRMDCKPAHQCLGETQLGKGFPFPFLRRSLHTAAPLSRDATFQRQPLQPSPIPNIVSSHRLCRLSFFCLASAFRIHLRAVLQIFRPTDTLRGGQCSSALLCRSTLGRLCSRPRLESKW